MNDNVILYDLFNSSVSSRECLLNKLIERDVEGSGCCLILGTNLMCDMR
jgi:hypothetical protein